MQRVKRLLLTAIATGPVLVAVLTVAAVTMAPPEPAEPAEATSLRAFGADTWWNAPVPADAPNHPREAAILRYMKTAREAGEGCVRLAGAGSSQWGQPVYWASSTDRSYDVRVSIGTRPPELAKLRIPAGASAARTSDRAMTIFDVSKGYVVALTGARYDALTRTWRAQGATVTYLDSNGLHARTGRADDPRNQGSHRGNNGATMMARYDEVRTGAIRHVLKVASGPETADRFVFPMIGSDGDTNDPVAPPQGLRFRIKPSVDIDALRLHPQAKVIAKALQRYGFYLGDSGGRTSLKLENTQASGQGQKWTVSAEALCGLPLDSRYWDVLPEGYDPSR